MKFLAMNDDVKFIIFKHLASDLKARSIISKYHDLQEILFGDVVYNDDLCTYFSLQYNAKENDDFKTAKIFKIRMYVCMYKYNVYVCVCACVCVCVCVCVCSRKTRSAHPHSIRKERCSSPAPQGEGGEHRGEGGEHRGGIRISHGHHL
jgi:hypothetical protein